MHTNALSNDCLSKTTVIDVNKNTTNFFVRLHLTITDAVCCRKRFNGIFDCSVLFVY